MLNFFLRFRLVYSLLEYVNLITLYLKLLFPSVKSFFFSCATRSGAPRWYFCFVHSLAVSAGTGKLQHWPQCGTTIPLPGLLICGNFDKLNILLIIRRWRDNRVNIQIMLEAFYLWYINDLLSYRNILRPAGLKYIPIY